MKRLCGLILCTILLSGCAPSALEQAAVPAPMPAAEETPVPDIAPPLHCSADEALADAPDMLPLYSPEHFIPIKTTLPANGDELFNRVYSTLSQKVWIDINEILSTIGDIRLDGSGLTAEALGTDGCGDSSLFDITTGVDMDMQLSYIEISTCSLNRLYLFFDIQGENHIPKFALLKHWRADGWKAQRIGNEKFVVYDYADTWGTGILVEKQDWYNVDTQKVEISYTHTAMIADRPWNPLGWWTFEGKLGEPQIKEISEGRHMLSFDTELALYRYTNREGEGVSFEKQPSLHLIYNEKEHRAHAIGGTDRWCFGHDGVSISTKLCCAYFKEELEELAAAGTEYENLWAQMLLLNDDWETVLARNGLQYDRDADMMLPIDEKG